MSHNLPACSFRIAELRKEIDAIANCPKASEETATKAVTLLLANYPGQQNPDPRIAQAMVRQMVNVCTGVDLDVLQAMIELKSSTSLLRQESSFLPNPAKVAEWIDWKMDPKRSRIGFYLDEIAMLERRSAPPPSEAERERVEEGFAKLVADLKAKSPKHRPAWKPGESLTPEENAKLDAWIADPNTPDLETKWKTAGEQVK